MFVCVCVFSIVLMILPGLGNEVLGTNKDVEIRNDGGKRIHARRIRRGERRKE